YMTNVGSAIQDSGVGDGWFKIGHSGYNLTTQKWCTQTLIANHGLLSFPIPADLAGALQDADKNPPNPQLYTGCAQIFVSSNGTALPRDTVKIPGYVGMEDEGVRFDVYKPVWPFPEPGPGVYVPGVSPMRVVEPVERQTEGVLPRNSVVTNANWWSVEVSPYVDEDGCWNASKTCYAQSDTCYKTAPPTGSRNCKVWEGRCSDIQTACEKGIFTGPPVFSLPVDGKSVSSQGLESTRSGQRDQTSVATMPNVYPTTFAALSETISTSSREYQSLNRQTDPSAAESTKFSEQSSTAALPITSTSDIATIQPSNPMGVSISLSRSLSQQPSPTPLDSIGSGKSSSVISSTATRAATSSDGFTFTDTIRRHPVTTFPVTETPPPTLTTSIPGLNTQSTPTPSIKSISESSRVASTSSSSLLTSAVSFITLIPGPTTPITSPSITSKLPITSTSTSTIFLISDIMKTITLVTNPSTSIEAQTTHNTTSLTVTTRTHSASLICKPNQRCVQIDPEMALRASLAQSQPSVPSQPTSPNPKSLTPAGSSPAMEDTSFTSATQSLSSSSISTLAVVTAITSALLTTKTGSTSASSGSASRAISSSSSTTDIIVSIEIIPSKHRTSATSLASVDIVPVADAITTPKGKEKAVKSGRRMGRVWSA
ncbi:hypothetical protein IFR05_017331, partial [Cadophora sp. M221]